MNIVIEINELSKDYETGFFRKKKVRALDGLNLKVRAGQIFGFLGGNGAGKTTTIKILMSLLKPTCGSARILGHEISDTAMHGRIGYCPENPYFYDHLSAIELLNYFGMLFGLERSLRDKRTEDLLDSVGIDKRDRAKHLRKFSKGMLQRVGLAQALMNDPEVVFLDEPMSGLDPIGRREIRELIASLRMKGKTVFMSTHILSDVETLCDEVAILRRGRLAATGHLNDLLERQSGARAFEICVRGIDAASLRHRLNGSGDASIAETGTGLRIEVGDEPGVEQVLSAVHAGGGSLVSVQTVRQSLEDLFVRETAGDE